MDFVWKLYGNTYAVHVTVALVGVATLNPALPSPPPCHRVCKGGRVLGWVLGNTHRPIGLPVRSLPQARLTCTLRTKNEPSNRLMSTVSKYSVCHRSNWCPTSRGQFRFLLRLRIVIQGKWSLTRCTIKQVVSCFLLHQKRRNFDKVIKFLVKQWKLTISRKLMSCYASKIVKGHYNWNLSAERNIRAFHMFIVIHSKTLVNCETSSCWYQIVPQFYAFVDPVKKVWNHSKTEHDGGALEHLLGRTCMKSDW